jgi:hypothetical protein
MWSQQKRETPPRRWLMDTTVISDEIKLTRQRLAEIDELREVLPADSFSERAELQDEEHRLHARLSALLDEASKAGVGMAEEKVSKRADTTRTPDLPAD